MPIHCFPKSISSQKNTVILCYKLHHLIHELVTIEQRFYCSAFRCIGISSPRAEKTRMCKRRRLRRWRRQPRLAKCIKPGGNCQKCVKPGFSAVTSGFYRFSTVTSSFYRFSAITSSFYRFWLPPPPPLPPQPPRFTHTPRKLIKLIMFYFTSIMLSALTISYSAVFCTLLVYEGKDL